MTATLRAPSIGAVLTLETLRTLDAGALIDFLESRRWFGGKREAGSGRRDTEGGMREGGGGKGPRFLDIVRLPWCEGAFAIARVEVPSEGRIALYQLPLAACAVDSLERMPTTTIAEVDAGGIRAVLFDAVEDQRFLRAVCDAFGKGEGEKHETDGLSWVVEPTSSQRLVVPPGGKIALGTAEQSNTSIVFDSIAILKAFRRLEAGIHPDVEMCRFLTTRAGFAHTPTLLGEMWFGEPNGARTVAGMLQEYVRGARDTWEFALELVAPHFRAAAAPAGKKSSTVPFIVEAGRIGSITREMHRALSSDRDDPAFAPEPATAADVERWANRVQQGVRDSMALLEARLEAGVVPEERVPEARALLQRREDYLGWVNEVVDSVGGDVGMRIRVHGDYHLGQLLRTASDDFIVIDFEGEPSRSLAERREKTSPLRDVAGMLRSLAYVAAVSATSVERDLDLRERELAAGRWERDARAAMLNAYFNDEGGADDVLPRARERANALLSLFEAEKVFYELAYELNHRPDWVGIPLRGISKLLFRG